MFSPVALPGLDDFHLRIICTHHTTNAAIHLRQIGCCKGFAGFFFGLSEAFAVRIQNVTDLPPNLVQILPQVATLLALILVAGREKLKLALTRRRFRQDLVDREIANSTGD